MPGKYTAKLTVDGQSVSVPIEVLPDPRVKVAPAELLEQVRLALAVRDDFNKLSASVERLRSIRTQLQTRNPLLKDIEKARPLAKASIRADRQARRPRGQASQSQGQGDLRHPGDEGGSPALLEPRLALRRVLEGDGPPTQGMREAAGNLGGQLGKLLDEFQALIDKDLAALNQQAKALDLPHILVPPPKTGP